MSYTEKDFKFEVITKARTTYGLPELKVNPWVNGANRNNLLNDMGNSYVEPSAGGVAMSAFNTSTAWRVYHKSNNENGDMFVGRLADTERLYQNCGLGAANSAPYNLDRGMTITVQKLKHWTVLINDCWMLGAIHRHRTFHLVSPISTVNDIWNPRGYFIVTGREMLGLKSFGYKAVKRGGRVSFICQNQNLASSATLSSYSQATNRAAMSELEKTKISLFAQGIC